MEYSEVISGANNVVFAPNSLFFAYSASKTLHIRDACVQLFDIVRINVKQNISSFAISPDSDCVAILMSKISTIVVYKITGQSGKPEKVCDIIDQKNGFAYLCWAPNSVQLVVAHEMSSIISVYNFTDGKVKQIRDSKTNDQKGIAFSKDGNFMAVLENGNGKYSVGIYFIESMEMVNMFPVDLWDPVQVLWSPDSSLLVVVDNNVNCRLVIFNHIMGEVLRYEPYSFALGIKSIQFSGDSKFLAVGFFDEKIRLINCCSLTEIAALDCSSPAINSEKTTVFQESQVDGNIKTSIFLGKSYKIPAQKISIHPEKGYPNQGIGTMEFNEDENYLACKNDNMPNTVWIWSIAKLEPIAIITCRTTIRSFKWCSKAGTLSIACGTDRVMFWEPKNHVAELLFTYQNKSIRIQNIIWSNNLEKMLLLEKNEFALAEVGPAGIF